MNPRIVGGNGRQPQIAVIEVDAAALSAGVPFDLIPAPGVGNIVFPIHVAAWYEPGETPYDAGKTINVGFDGASLLYYCPFDFDGLEPQLGYFVQDNVNQYKLAEANNKALQMWVQDEFPPAGGDGKLYIIVVYSIVWLVSNAPVYLDDNRNSPLNVIKSLSSAELVGSDSVYPVVVPAPGEGKVAVLVNSYGILKAGSVPFSGVLNAEITYENSAQPILDNTLAYGAYEWDTVSVGYLDDWQRFSGDVDDPRNQALVFWNNGGPLSAGNGTADLLAWYYIFDTVTKTVTSGAGSGLRYRSAKLDKALINEMTSEQVLRDVISSPGATELILLFASASRYTFNANPYGYGGFWTLTWRGLSENGYACYIETQADETEDTLAFGVQDYGNVGFLPDLQGAPLAASSADQTATPPGDGAVDFLLWFAVLEPESCLCRAGSRVRAQMVG